MADIVVQDTVAGLGTRTNVQNDNVPQAARGFSYRSQTNLQVDEKGLLAVRGLSVDTINQARRIYAKANEDLNLQVGCLWPRPTESADTAASFVQDQGIVSPSPPVGTRGVAPHDLIVSTLLHDVPDQQVVGNVTFGDGAGASGAALVDAFAVQSMGFDAPGSGQTALRVRDLSGLTDLGQVDYMLVSKDAAGNIRYKQFLQGMIDNRWYIEQTVNFVASVPYSVGTNPPYSRDQVSTCERLTFSAPDFSDRLFILPFNNRNYIELAYPPNVTLTSVTTNGSLVSYAIGVAHILLDAALPFETGGPRFIELAGSTTVGDLASRAISVQYAKTQLPTIF